jgi:hypothetical protein
MLMAGIAAQVVDTAQGHPAQVTIVVATVLRAEHQVQAAGRQVVAVDKAEVQVNGRRVGVQGTREELDQHSVDHQILACTRCGLTISTGQIVN